LAKKKNASDLELMKFSNITFLGNTTLLRNFCFLVCFSSSAGVREGEEEGEFDSC